MIPPTEELHIRIFLLFEKVFILHSPIKKLYVTYITCMIITYVRRMNLILVFSERSLWSFFPANFILSPLFVCVFIFYFFLRKTKIERKRMSPTATRFAYSGGKFPPIVDHYSPSITILGGNSLLLHVQYKSRFLLPPYTPPSSLSHTIKNKRNKEVEKHYTKTRPTQDLNK